MGLRSRLRSWIEAGDTGSVEEAVKALTPDQVPERAGYLYGVPRGGLNDVNAGLGASTQTDRRTELQQLYESFLACPWAWACGQAIARTITAGGIAADWDADTQEGDEEPEKPENVKALERLIAFVNPDQDIRQLARNVVVDLQVFGDALLEVAWWGDTPVALWNLDVPTTNPVTDEHGVISGWVQVTDAGQRAEFSPREVIHISLDAPRSGVFGVSPTQASLLPITAWLFAAATGKEMFRKGLPATVHADFPAGASKTEQDMWVAQVMARNIGPRNIGRPWVTKGGAKLTELQTGKVADVLEFLNQKRDEILAGYGVPPAKVGVIESGNLGGGTGSSQDKTFKINTCMPIAELILEKLNFAITRNGFGIDGWHLKFRDVDYRDDQVIEQIRDTRLRNGAWILDRYRADIGEPPVEGGDAAVLVDRQNLVLWRDMARMSEAMIASKGAPAVAAGMPQGEQMQDGPPQGAPPGQQGGGQDDQGQQEESVSPVMLARYRARLHEALRSTPVTEAEGGTGQAVYDLLAPDFPASAIAWIKDDATDWSGPRQVPLDQIDIHDSREWDATRPADAARITAARRKLRKKIAAGRKPKPVILIRWPGAEKWIISDGHHRFVAAQREGLDKIWAYTGKVPRERGHWLSMASHEDRGSKKAA